MTYLELIRDADRQLEDGRITLGEYENMIKPLEQQIQPEVVRCRDCKHKGTKNCVANAWITIFGFGVKDDFYCGRAERRTDEIQNG